MFNPLHSSVVVNEVHNVYPEKQKTRQDTGYRLMMLSHQIIFRKASRLSQKQAKTSVSMEENEQVPDRNKTVLVRAPQHQVHTGKRKTNIQKNRSTNKAKKKKMSKMTEKTEPRQHARRAPGESQGNKVAICWHDESYHPSYVQLVTNSQQKDYTKYQTEDKRGQGQRAKTKRAVLYPTWYVLCPSWWVLLYVVGDFTCRMKAC